MPTNIDEIRIVRVEEVTEESPTVRTLRFKDELSENAKPGQFDMVWIPRTDELPMSVMIAEPDGYAAFTIRKHGKSSTAFYNTPVNGFLGVRGPYGNSFTIKNGKVLLVGGGTGLVPLMRLSKQMLNRNSDVTLIIGAKIREEVLFEDYAETLLKKIKHKIIVTTEDGSYGIRGLATDVAEELMEKDHFDMVYTCGPERMMKKVVELAASNGIPSEASLERLMKCGIGICCSCCVGRYLLCKDGPVLDGKEVLKQAEFGAYARDKSGRLADMW